MNPKRLTTLLAAALGAVAIFVLPGLASADNGRHNGERHNAGTIVSFDAGSGMLTIDRFGDDNISGLVTDGTRIKCEDHRGDHRRRGHSGDDNRLRSNSGPGSGEAGDDNGGRGEAEPGDDHGGRGEAEPGDDNGGRGEVEPGDDNGVGHNHHGRCDSSDLTVGAVVRKADRELEGDTIVFDEIELAHSR